jgi:starvation-inducible DNA-binding protein
MTSATVVGELEKLLADSYTLYLKSQKFHWNVTGPHFSALHALFEAQYTELAMAVDEIAERIRALGELSPGSFTEFAELATVKDSLDTPDAMAMVRELAADHRSVAGAAKAVISAAEHSDDDVSVDLGVRRADAHDKAAWMLESHLA